MEEIKQFIDAISLLCSIGLFIWVLLDLVETEFNEKSIAKVAGIALSVFVFVVLF